MTSQQILDHARAQEGNWCHQVARYTKLFIQDMNSSINLEILSNRIIERGQGSFGPE